MDQTQAEGAEYENGSYADSMSDAPFADTDLTVSWQASEYVHHPKQASWYIGLAAAIGVVTAGTYLLTRDWMAPVVIAVMGVAVWVFASKQPRTLAYSLNSKGVQVGDKSYLYDQFRSFAIISEGAMSSVLLSPLKRFMPPLSLYYAPEDEEKIVTLLSLHLPHNQSQPDFVERLSSRLRF